MLNLARDLTHLGWQVEVLAPHAAGAADDEQLEGVRVRRFRYARDPARQVVAYGGGALFNVRRSRRVAVQVPALVACEWWAARRLLRSRRYDVVQSHWLLPQGAVAAMTAPRAGVPHLATVHGSDVLGLDGAALRRVKAGVLRRTQAVTVNSAATEAAVRALAPPGLPVHRIPMGITVHAAEPAPPRDPPSVGYVGRLVGWKGVADLLEAVALLRAGSHPELLCVVGGTGPEEEALRTQAERLGIAAAVSFLGWVDPETVPALIASWQVAVFPSRLEVDGTTEGQGLSILEAMAQARPVVASRVGGIPDSLTDGVHGLLVDQRSPALLARAVASLLDDPERAAAMGRAGRERAVGTFSREASARAFDAVLRGLAGR